MAVDIIFRNTQKPCMHFIDTEEDIIEQERRLKKPRHKRLEFVAGWNIHQLVKDARKSRPMLHTRAGFHLKSTVSDISSVFEIGSTRSSRTGTASTKSSNRSSITTVSSSTLNTTFRFYDLMHFHHIHGSNIVLSCDRHTATRKSNNFCNGLVFLHRPLKWGETIHLRFNKIRPDWRGCIRLGFTPHNPGRCDPTTLPSYAVPDLSRKSRFWAVPIKEKYGTKYNIFSFVCREDGSVSYMINNENKGTFLTGLNVKRSLWPMIDLYGKVEELAVVDEETAKHGASVLAHTSTDDHDDDETGSRRNSAAKVADSSTCFHEVCGQNVKMDSQRRTAKRFDSFWNALTFTLHPLRLFDIIYLEIGKTEINYAGSLGVGITNINPSTLCCDDLPDNADLLSTTAEQYWKISRDIESSQGDQLGFMLDKSGCLFYSKNGLPKVQLFSDVPSLGSKWLIFDVYGRTTMIKLLGQIKSFDPDCETTVQKYAFERDEIHDEESEKECLMCFKRDRIRDCTIQPCGHLALCNWCAITCMVKQQLRFIVCPICGGPVKDVVRILRHKASEEAESDEMDLDAEI